MNLAPKTLGLVAAAVMLSACSVFDSDDEEDLEPTKLVDIETKIDVRRQWSSKIGDGAEFLYRHLESPVTNDHKDRPVGICKGNPHSGRSQEKRLAAC